MKASYVFTLNAVLGLIFGLAFVLVPEQTVALYGVDLNAAGLYIARLLGGAFLSYALLTWTVRYAVDSRERRAIVLALLVANAIGLVASLLAQLSGIANALGWSTVVIYLIFVLGYGYLQFVREPTMAEPGMAG
jgi:hypothetical protein